MNLVICTLEPDINKCPHYNEENHICMSESPCSFAKKEERKELYQKYVREERWYEKYYRK